VKNVISVVERFNDRSLGTLEFNLDRRGTTSYGMAAGRLGAWRRRAAP
jgi:hypothetical protein